MSYLADSSIPLDICYIIAKFLPSEALVPCAEIENSSFNKPRILRECADEELDVHLEDSEIKQTLKDCNKNMNILKNLVSEKKLVSYCIEKGYFRYFKKYWEKSNVVAYTDVIYSKRFKFLKYVILEAGILPTFTEDFFGHCHRYTDQQIIEIIDIHAPKVTTEDMSFVLPFFLAKNKMSLALYAYEKYKASISYWNATKILNSIEPQIILQLPKDILFQICDSSKNDRQVKELIYYVVTNSPLEIIKYFESYIVKYNLAKPYHLALERGDKEIVSYMFSEAGGKVEYLPNELLDTYIKIMY
jgi:hypothetical protein